MSCRSIPFETMQTLPYGQLKDLCENHEKFSSSKPEVQRTLCEFFSKEQKREPICQWPIKDNKVSEIVHIIACEAIKKGEESELKTVLSLATGWNISTTTAKQRMAIAENISPFLLLETMEECVCQANQLERWVEEDKSRVEAAKAILAFLTNPSSGLELSDHGMTSLPPFISKKGFHGVTCLALSNNKLKKFPELSAFSAVEDLYLVGNEISTVPQNAEGIDFIQNLSLNRNQIPSVPDNLIGFQSLKILRLARNGIRAIPEKVSFPDSLEELTLSENRISVIPENLEGLGKVKRLYLTNNEITELPGNFKGLERLELLSLSGNKISKFPKTIGGLRNLKILYFFMYPAPQMWFLRAWGLSSLEHFNA